MAYYIFLKSLRSPEEFRKNTHVKIPPKSPCANFQSLGKFKNPIFNSKISFLCFRPGRPCSPLGLWPSRLPLASPLPQAEAHGQPRPLGPRVPLVSLQKYAFSFDSRLPFSAPSLYPPLTHGPRALDPSSRPHRLTPVRNSLRRRSPRRPLRTSDAVKSLPPLSSFPHLNPLQTEP
jgi:hypothetical protein